MKRDGHTHTEYCLHGEVKDTEELIKKAIFLGFNEYSITEHAPLPSDFEKKAGGDSIVWESASMKLNDVEHYLKKMHSLKKKYASDIKINVGFEVDYLQDFEGYTRDFLDEYGKQMDDGILSVHFLPGKFGLRAIDYSYEDYLQGIVSYYESFQGAQLAYYSAIITSINANLGEFKPTRIGHPSLCQKFQRGFIEETSYSEGAILQVDEMLQEISDHNYSIDLNAAGLFKEGCQETYPPTWIIEKARKLSIPLVYGSDSHSLEDIGRGYNEISEFLA